MQGPPSVAAAGTRVGMTKSQSWRRSAAYSHLSDLDTCSLYSTSARWTFQRFFEALLSYTADMCYIRNCTHARRAVNSQEVAACDTTTDRGLPQELIEGSLVFMAAAHRVAGEFEASQRRQHRDIQHADSKHRGDL